MEPVISFVYVGKHTNGVSVDLPGRTIVVKPGVPFDVNEDEADLLAVNPNFEYTPDDTSDLEDEN